MSDSLAFQPVWHVDSNSNIPQEVKICCSWHNYSLEKAYQLAWDRNANIYRTSIDVPTGDHLFYYMVDGKRAINKKLETAFVNNEHYNIVVNDGTQVHMQSADKVTHIVKRFQQQSNLSPNLLTWENMSDSKPSLKALSGASSMMQSIDLSSETESTRFKRISFSKFDERHKNADTDKIGSGTVKEYIETVNQQLFAYQQIIESLETHGILSTQQVKSIIKFAKNYDENNNLLNIVISEDNHDVVAGLNTKIRKLRRKMKVEETKKNEYVLKLRKSFEQLKEERENECELYEEQINELQIENMELQQIVEKLEEQLQKYEAQLNIQSITEIPADHDTRSMENLQREVVSTSPQRQDSKMIMINYNDNTRNSAILDSMRQHVQKLGSQLANSDETQSQLLTQIEELKASLEYYQLESQQYHTKNENLKQENDHYEKKLADLGEQLRQYESDKILMNEKLAHLEESMAKNEKAYQDSVTRVSLQLKSKTDETDILNMEASKLNDSNSQLTKKIIKLEKIIETENSQHETEVTQLKEQINHFMKIQENFVKDLENAVETKNNDTSQLTEKIKLIEQEKENLTNEFTKQIHELEGKLNKSLEIINELRYKYEVKMEQTVKESQKWKKIKGSQNAKIKDLEDATKKLETELENLRIALQDSCNINDNAEKEKQILTSQLKSLEDANKDNQTTIQLKLTQIQKLKQKIETLETNDVENKQELKVEQKEHEIKSLQNKIDDLNKIVLEQQRSHNNMLRLKEEEISKLHQSIVDINAKHNAEINGLMPKTKQLETKIAELQDQIHVQSGNLQFKQKQLNQAQKQFKQLKIKYDQKIARISSLSNQRKSDATLMQEKITDYSQLSQKYDKLKTLFEESIDKCKKFETANGRLRTIKEKLKNEISDLKIKLGELQKNYDSLQKENMNHTNALKATKKQQINQMRDSLQRSSILKQEYKEQVVVFEQTLLERNETINQLSAQVDQLSDDINSKCATIQELEKKLLLSGKKTNKSLSSSTGSSHSFTKSVISPPRAFSIDLMEPQIENQSDSETVSIDKSKAQEALIKKLKGNVQNLKYTIKLKNEEAKSFTEKSNAQIAKIMDLKTQLRKLKSDMKQQQKTNNQLQSNMIQSESISSLQKVISRQSNKINEMQLEMREMMFKQHESNSKFPEKPARPIVMRNSMSNENSTDSEHLKFENEKLKQQVDKLKQMMFIYSELIIEFRDQVLASFKQQMIKFVNDQKKDINTLLRYLNVYITTHPSEFPRYHSDYRDSLQIIKKNESPLERLKRTSKTMQYESTLKKHYFSKALSVFNGKIKTICKVRPMLEHEVYKNIQSVIKCNFDQRAKLHSVTVPLVNYSIDQSVQKFQKVYFDNVVSGKKMQNEAASFRQIQDNIIATMDGYNVTVMCYGATGSGKTFTMQNLREQVLSKLFEMSDKLSGDYDYKFQVSMFEIYNEKLRDLLNPKNNKKLKVRQCSAKGVYVENVHEFEITDLEECLKILNKRETYRIKRATKMNHDSSRSHLVIQIKVNGECIANGSQTFGLINLVDLAGSERLRRLVTKDEKILKESKSINKSLSALCTVLNVLANNSNQRSKVNKNKKSKRRLANVQQFVPYRNSLLTRILQQSLSGKGKCLMYFNVSPAENHLAETLATINFAQNVVKNVQFQESVEQNIKWDP